MPYFSTIRVLTLLLCLPFAGGCSSLFPERTMSRERESGTIVAESSPGEVSKAVSTWYVLVPSLTATYPQLAVWQVPTETMNDVKADTWNVLRQRANLQVHVPDHLVNDGPMGATLAADPAAEAPVSHAHEPAALSLLQRELTRLRAREGVNVCLDAIAPDEPPPSLSYPTNNLAGSPPVTECSLRILDTGRVHTGQAAFIAQQMEWVTKRTGKRQPASSAGQWQLLMQALEDAGAGELSLVYADPHSNIIAVLGPPGLLQHLDRLLAYPAL